MTTERRAATELRVAGRSWLGHAAVLGCGRISPGCSPRRLRPAAFRRSLAANADVVGLVDHDPSMLLARTRSGTLRLAEDARGLSFELDIPDTQLARISHTNFA